LTEENTGQSILKGFLNNSEFFELFVCNEPPRRKRRGIDRGRLKNFQKSLLQSNGFKRPQLPIENSKQTPYFLIRQYIASLMLLLEMSTRVVFSDES